MKVLFIDTVHSILWDRLITSGFECVEGYHLTREEILQDVHKFDGIVIRSRTKIDQTFFNAATSLKFIARSGAGLENIDLKIAAAKGVAVFNSPEGNMDAVGEHCVGVLLMLFNHLKRADSEVRNGIWRREENRGHEIKGKTIGIIGYGSMGRAFAKKLSGFECRVLAYDKFKSGYGDQYCEESTMEALFEACDVVSLHTPGGIENKYIVDAQWLVAFKKPICLINTARGINVHTEALVDALKSKQVYGACLDVLEFEKSSFEQLKADALPASFQYLVASENVILSPHIAGWTHESYAKLSDFLANKIIEKFG